MAETLEGSDHTSVQRRIEGLVDEACVSNDVGGDANDGGGEAHDGRSHRSTIVARRLRPSELIRVGCLRRAEPICDKGFLAMPIEDYLELLDWTARQTASGKRDRTPAEIPPILVRLGLDRATWCELVSDFGRLFCCVAGRPACVDAMRCHRTHRRYHLRRRARELLTAD
ncbi:hypothetical protein [Allorhodopirellula solitaria]|uniref:hypothetical protein n=1 Tax=Allorhodopirellula solitaria TaxID=2527987 RepID=UPI001FE58C4A|nr:hypothetical protein [Allorhodopirellula solitaria]